MRIVVVGSGIAGLVAAFRASARHEVVLVTKSELAESNTRYAQGGIAAALSSDDSVSAHIADTVRAGDGLCDLRAVEVLCSEGPQRVRDLVALGVEFDRLADGELARGHEAAHSHRRVVHAGGDATGLAIETALLRAVAATAVEVHEHTFLDELVVESGRVTGVLVIGPDGRRRRLDADRVVLASGGAGQLFRHTTNPAVATGDGVAAAHRAGAELGDLEFYQFHPTALAVPGTPLVSEAVRGEGAVLLDRQGRRFMLDVHPDAELAPRDVVARGIAAAMAAQDGEPVLLDATGLGAGLLRSRFPGITRVTSAHGLDWTRDPVPVTPAAHYWMGGIRTDVDGRTSLPGLFAVGEVADTGVHGANRLASNSLLESLVFAWRAAEAMDEPVERSLVRPALPFVGEPSDTAASPRRDVDPAPTRERAPMTRSALQQVMWTHVGLTRDASGLSAALDTLERWAPPAGGTVRDREDANLLQLGRLVTRAALARRESRGAHFRSDAPVGAAAPVVDQNQAVPA